MWAPGLANKAKDWELAVDENGNALIDLLEVPVRMTFDSSSLTGEPKADTDGRALPSSNLYTLRVTGICSTLNNNFATAAFMSFDRLQEMTQANANYMGATTQTKTAEEKANHPTYDLVWVMVKNVNDAAYCQADPRHGAEHLFAQRYAGDGADTVPADPGDAGRAGRYRCPDLRHLRGKHHDDVHYGTDAEIGVEGAGHRSQRHL